MEEKKNIKKNKIVKVTALLGLFLLVFGVSYALFSVVLNGTKRNRITTGNLSLQLLNEEGNTLNGDTIGLENALPMTDEEGKATTPYTFTLKNNGTMDAEYSLTLNDIPLETGEEQLLDKYVTMYIEKGTNVTEAEGPYLLSDIKNRIIDAGVIKKGMSATYKVYLWVDEAADNNAMNKVFSAGLKVDGYQVTKDTLSRSILHRESFNKEGVSTLYADGKIDVVGSGKVNARDISMPSKSNRRYCDYQISLLERAGYNLSEIDVSTTAKLKTFIKNTASKNEEYTKIVNKDIEETLKKYGVEQSEIDKFINGEYTEFVEYTDTIIEENPELARKILYEEYLMDGQIYIETELGIVAINLDDRIEDLTFGTRHSVPELTLPTSLKKVRKLSVTVPSIVLPDTIEYFGEGPLSFVGLNVDELTIPASVKYVGAYAFQNSGVKKINILGSTEGWDANWNSLFDGTINQS